MVTLTSPALAAMVPGLIKQFGAFFILGIAVKIAGTPDLTIKTS
jgi:hypothetical protein